MALFSKEIIYSRLNTYGTEFDPGKRTVIFAAGDPGSGGAVIPVVSLLARQNDYNLVLYAGQTSEPIAEREGLRRLSLDFHYDEAIDRLSSGLIVTGTSSSGPNHERGLVRYAIDRKGRRKKAVESMWIMDTSGRFGITNLAKQIACFGFPGHICVPNEHTAIRLKEQYGEKLTAKVHITGQPAYDTMHLSQEQRLIERQNIREQLQIAPSDKIIMFAGQLRGTKESLNALVEELNKVDTPPALLPRFHPRDQNKDSYEELLKTYKGKVVSTGNFTSEEVLHAADLIISMYSTLNIKAAHLNIPAISLLSEKEAIAMYRYEHENRGPETDDEILSGAVIGIFDRGQIQNTVQNVLYAEEPKSALQNNKSLAYPTDGKNTERVAQVIQSIMQ